MKNLVYFQPLEGGIMTIVVGWLIGMKISELYLLVLYVDGSGLFAKQVKMMKLAVGAY